MVRFGKPSSSLSVSVSPHRRLPSPQPTSTTVTAPSRPCSAGDSLPLSPLLPLLARERCGGVSVDMISGATSLVDLNFEAMSLVGKVRQWGQRVRGRQIQCEATDKR